MLPVGTTEEQIELMIKQAGETGKKLGVEITPTPKMLAQLQGHLGSLPKFMNNHVFFTHEL